MDQRLSTTTATQPGRPQPAEPQPADPAGPTTPTRGGHRVSRRAVIGGALGVFLTAAGGTAWAALDRFVIDDVKIAHVSSYEASQGVTPVAATAAASAEVTSTTYSSDTATLAIRTVSSGSGSSALTYFVADLTVTDVTVLRSAFADDEFGQNIIADPSTIAEQVGAVFAINGDYYGFRDTGTVIRNGVAYRDAGARQGLALDRDGTMRLYDETTTTAAALVDGGVWQTWSFGPGLVDDGAVIDGIDQVEVDTNFGNHSVQGTQPRTGIGMIEPGHYLFVVADGRAEGYSDGVTMSGFAQIFADLGATVAYNLDGGGSSTMVFDGHLVNNPLGRGQERGTSDIIYLAG